MKNPTDEFKVGDRVVYIPFHAQGNPDHDSCEYGIVTGKDTRSLSVLVNDDISRKSKSCNPANVKKL